jgi:hypothetical protein
VLLAEVPSDLQRIRDEVRRYLTQAGVRVHPRDSYPSDRQALTGAIDKDLVSADLFVQLLSENRGVLVGDWRESLVGIQHERARRAGVQILQWLSPQLDPQSIEDPAYRDFLRDFTVHVTSLNEFKQMIVQRATAPVVQNPQSSAFPNRLVFIDAESGDAPIAQSIAQVFSRRGIAWAISASSGTPGQLRDDFEEQLMEADGLILIYGSAPLAWVRSRLMHARKTLARRPGPFTFIALYETGATRPKAPVNLGLPDMLYLKELSMGLEETLKPVLERLESSVAS